MGQTGIGDLKAVNYMYRRTPIREILLDVDFYYNISELDLNNCGSMFLSLVMKSFVHIFLSVG